MYQGIRTWFFLIGPKPVRLAIFAAFVCAGISAFLAVKVRDQVIANRTFICDTAALQTRVYSDAATRESVLSHHAANLIDRRAHGASAELFRRIGVRIVQITPSYCDPATGRVR